jgi:hypothetical protein
MCQVCASSGSLIIWLKPKAKKSLRTVAMFLFYLLQELRERNFIPMPTFLLLLLCGGAARALQP